MTITADALTNLVYAFVILAGIREIGAYCQARLFVTGRPFFERKPEHQDSETRARVIHPSGERW